MGERRTHALLRPLADGHFGALAAQPLFELERARSDHSDDAWERGALELTDPEGNTLGSRTVSGFRLVNGRASYGIGLETFALGFPIHFDWSYRTMFNKPWEDIVYVGQGGSEEFRKVVFAVWMGYDF